MLSLAVSAHAAEVRVLATNAVEGGPTGVFVGSLLVSGQVEIGFQQESELAHFPRNQAATFRSLSMQPGGARR